MKRHNEREVTATGCFLTLAALGAVLMPQGGLLAAAAPPIVIQPAPSPAPAPTPAPSGRPAQGPPDGLIPPAPGGRPPRDLTPQQPDIIPVTPAPTPAPAGEAPVAPQPRAEGAIRPATNLPNARGRDQRGTQLPNQQGPRGEVRTLPPAEQPTAGAPVPDLLPEPEGETNIDAPAAQTDATPVPEADAAPLLGIAWPWLAAALAALLALGAWLLLRRKASPVAPVEWEQPAAEVAPAPRAAADPRPEVAEPLAAHLPEPVAAPVPEVATPAPATSARKGLAKTAPQLSLEPLSATATLINLRMRYALTVTNGGKTAISVSQLTDRLFTGTDANEALLQRWMADAQTQGGAAIDGAEIAAGESWRREAEIVMPLAEVRGVQIGARSVFLPVLAVALSYRHATGVGAVARAFVIGREGGSDGRLAPLRFDIGARGVQPIAARDTGIGTGD